MPQYSYPQTLLLSSLAQLELPALAFLFHKPANDLILPPSPPHLPPSSSPVSFSLLPLGYISYYIVIVVAEAHLVPRAVWFNAIAVSGMVGIALNAAAIGHMPLRRYLSAKPIQTMRLFMIPFCVSSISGIATGVDEGEAFILVFPENPEVLGAAFGAALAVPLLLRTLALLLTGRVCPAGSSDAEAPVVANNDVQPVPKNKVGEDTAVIFSV